MLADAFNKAGKLKGDFYKDIKILFINFMKDLGSFPCNAKVWVGLIEDISNVV